MKKFLPALIFVLILIGCAPQKLHIPTIPERNIRDDAVNIIFANDTSINFGFTLNWINHPWRDVQPEIKPRTMANDSKMIPGKTTWGSIYCKKLNELSYWELIWYDCKDRFFIKHLLIVNPGKYVIIAYPDRFECDGCSIQKDQGYTIFTPN